MPEYIEREALIEDIGETVLFSVRKGVRLPTPEMRGANNVIDRIKSAPTADVVEVVRCKDCYYYSENRGICINTAVITNFYRCTVKPNEYCSHGKRQAK